MSFLSTLEPHVFLYILSSISEGLTALGAQLNNYTGLCGTGTHSIVISAFSFAQTYIESVADVLDVENCV